MRRGSCVALGLLAALVLQACGTMADIAGCRIELADARGGTVTNVTQFTQAGALRLANAHCAQYGRVARETGFDWGDTRMAFACVAP